MNQENKTLNVKPFREKTFNAEFMSLIEAGQHQAALEFLFDNLPALLASGMNRQEKLNHLLFTPRLVQNGIHTKHGTKKLLNKAGSVARAIQRNGLQHRDLFVDFGAGAHDPIALSVYFYLNGFERVVANDMLPPRNLTFSALSMRDILADMHARPEAFQLPDSDPQLFMRRLREFDIEAFRDGRFYDGFAATEGRVGYVVDDIVNANIGDETASIIVSFAVFEHVSDMEGVLTFLYGRTAPGGLGFHFIDMADHRSYRAGNQYDAFTFLTEEDGPNNINRLRKSEQIQEFSNAGFEILRAEGRTMEIPEATRAKILPKWQKMSEDDLSTFNVTLDVRKPI